MTAAGTSSWCFVTHNGVRRPSGKVGEPGDNGEMGEWRTYGVVEPEGVPSGSIVGLVGAEVLGGLALRGGSW